MKQGQKSIIKKLITNNSGQAVVEYVLLAIIVVSLVLGMSKVFTALDDGFNQYMGGYISCLMEYGELPSLGVKVEDLKKHTGSTGKKCDAQFASFTFADGRPPTGGGGSSGGGGSGPNQSSGSGRNGSNGSGSGDGSGKGNGSGGSVGDNDGDGDSGDTASGFSSGRGGGRGRGGDKGRGAEKMGSYATADSPNDYDSSKTRVIEEEEEDESAARDRARKRRNLTNNGGYEPYRAITGRMKQEIEKQQRRRSTPRQPTRSVTTLTKEDPRFVPTKKALPNRVVASEGAEMRDSGGKFTFGNILKWLLIAAMALAIIIFLGGQALNYSNSKD